MKNQKTERVAFDFWGVIKTFFQNGKVPENNDDIEKELNEIKRQQDSSLITKYERNLISEENKAGGRKSDRMNIKVNTKKAVAKQSNDRPQETEKERE